MPCRTRPFQRLAVALVRRRRFWVRRVALPEQTTDSGLGGDAHAEAMGPLPDLSSEVQLTQVQLERVKRVKQVKLALAGRRLAWRSRGNRARATR